jgi:hypothetical protein
MQVLYLLLLPSLFPVSPAEEVVSFVFDPFIFILDAKIVKGAIVQRMVQ